MERGARLTIAKSKDEQYQGLKRLEHLAHAKITDAIIRLDSLQRQLELRQAIDGLDRSFDNLDLRVTIKLDDRLVIQARIPFHQHETLMEVDGVPRCRCCPALPVVAFVACHGR